MCVTWIFNGYTWSITEVLQMSTFPTIFVLLQVFCSSCIHVHVHVDKKMGYIFLCFHVCTECVCFYCTSQQWSLWRASVYFRSSLICSLFLHLIGLFFFFVAWYFKFNQSSMCWHAPWGHSMWQGNYLLPSCWIGDVNVKILWGVIIWLFPLCLILLGLHIC